MRLETVKVFISAIFAFTYFFSWSQERSEVGAISEQVEEEIVEDSCEWYIPNVITYCCGSVIHDFDCHIFGPVTDCSYDFYQMTIYDRWGIIVFETSDINQGWDPDSQNMMTGVYYYVIEVQKDKEDPSTISRFNGPVTFLK